MRLTTLLPCLSLLAGLLGVDTAHAESAKPSPAATASGDATASNALTLAMYAKLRDTKGNLFFSGTSLRDALGVAYLGAQGSTKSEMAAALHLDADTAKSAANAKQELADWSAARGSSDLTIANRLWTDKTFVMQPAFTASAADAYGSSASLLDFRADTNGARSTINAWVGKQTHDRIPELLPEGSVSSQTRLVITNAIYFKGEWASAFAKSSTKDEPFFVDGTTAKNAPMMHQTATFASRFDGDVKVLEMKYDKSDLAMDILLPSDKDGLARLEAGLTAQSFAAYTSNLGPNEVVVTMPKTTFTWGGSMKSPLQTLGMTQAFEQSASFRGISSASSGGQDLFITDVVQKAFVAIDEKGTEAAAATGVVFAPTSVMLKPPPKELRVDHPFVFAIRDVKRGRVLFMGRVTNPSA